MTNDHFMQPEFLKTLFNYHHQCNQKLAAAYMERQEQVSERSVKLFSHVLNAHHIWNSRIRGTKPACAVWDVQQVEVFLGLDLQNYEDSLQILEQYDLGETVTYRTSTNQEFSNAIGDILFHVINHSTYHRGQIASDFKQQGIAPLVTDYIFWKREGQ